MNTNPKIDRLKAMAAELREMFPHAASVTLESNSYHNEPEVIIHGHKTYDEATNEMRELGVGDREKHPYLASASMGSYTRLTGTAGGLTVTTYPDELPPSCRLVEEVERIPKTETRETGEFIEVKRTKIVCGELAELEGK